MEHLDNTQDTIPTLNEEQTRLLGSLGLYDCSLDVYESRPHTDSIWVVRSNN